MACEPNTGRWAGAGGPAHDAEAGHPLPSRPLVTARMAARGRAPFLGGSMVPVLRPGDTVRFGPCKVSPSAGDIVLYAVDGRFAAHRVLYVDEAGQAVITRGDACLRRDPIVAIRDVAGIVDGLEDPRTGAAVPFTGLRRIWNSVMRLLVRRGGRRRWAALALGCGAALMWVLLSGARRPMMRGAGA